MKTLRRSGAVILTVWLAVSAVQTQAANKRFRPDASLLNDTLLVGPASGPAPPDPWSAPPAARAVVSPKIPITSPWAPNNGAGVLNARAEPVALGTIDSSWNNIDGGNWSTAADWTPNGVPNNGGGNTYNVTLPEPSQGDYTVYLDISATVNSLAIDGPNLLITDAGTALTVTTLSLNNSGALYVGGTGAGGSSTLTVNSPTTIATSAELQANYGSTLIFNGDLNNSGYVYTGAYSGGNSLTVTGTFTNNPGADVQIDGAGDVMNVATLINSGYVTINNGATLNLTNQPNGITDVPAGSSLTVGGTLNAGSANGLAQLSTVEGTLNLNNGQTTSVTPSGGTLTIASGGSLNLSNAGVSSGTTTLWINGNVSNSGGVGTGFYAGTNVLNVSGSFTNNAGANLTMGDSLLGGTSVVSVGSLSNLGTVDIGTGGTLNLTNQPNGITDIPQGSTLEVEGNLKAGSANGLAKLTTVEGSLNLDNGQLTAVTPSGGTLTIASGGNVTLNYYDGPAATLSISGNMSNSGSLTMGFAAGSTVNVSGAFTNNAGGKLTLYGPPSGGGSVVNVGSLSNLGTVTIGLSDTLNLTNQPGGITDVPAGSRITIQGTLNAGSANGLANLTSVEGELDLDNGQSNAFTPNGGTLTIAAGGNFGLSNTATSNTTLNLTGNVDNSGTFQTGSFGGTNTVNLSGRFTNNAGAAFNLQSSNDLVNVRTLSNHGTVDIGGVLNLTASGTLINSGTINVGTIPSGFDSTGTLKISSSAVTVVGGGKIIMSNSAGNLITGGAPADVLTSTNTIEGSGNIGGGNMGFVNSGTVLANQSTALIIDTSSEGFNNKGMLTVSAGDTLQITGGSFLNFSGGTLTGGTYSVSGTLQYNNTSDITTNVATISLAGATAAIEDQNGKNALAGFAMNGSTGKLTVSGGQNLSDSASAVTNAGTLTVSKNSKLTLSAATATYTQNAGRTTVDGTLTAKGGITFNGGSVFGNGGTLSDGTGAVTNNASFNLGDQLMTAGKEKISGKYTQTSAGSLDISIGGTTAGTQFGELDITSVASLNGIFNLDLFSGFVPTLGQTFDILNASSVGGTFSTVNGTGINGSEHFSVVYNSNNVTLDVVSGAAATGSTFLPVELPSSDGAPASSTPEPASPLLLGTGLVGVAAWRRRGNIWPRPHPLEDQN